MARVGKRLQNARKLIEPSKLYSVEEAVSILESLPKAKFDESVDLCISLGVNPRKAEENVRATVALPHGRGRVVRVAAFCKGDKAKEAEAAGADFVGAEDLVQKIQGGWMDFDAAVATPDAMALVGRIGKLLGPRGLMPNPKVGTVSADIAKAVEAIKSGRVEFRVEKAGIVHVGLALVSFGAEKIKENSLAVIEAVLKAKPPTSKGAYVKSAYISTTMGPGIPLDVSAFKV
jgi:large subunit ribosomal protein L1